MKSAFRVGLFLLAAGCAACLGGRGPALPREAPVLDTYLRPKIRQAEGRTLIAADGVMLPAAPELGAFYARHRDHLVWSGAGGPLPVADSFLEVLQAREEEGLSRQGYHLEAIEAAWQGWRRGGGSRRGLVRLAELDLLLTNAFLRRAAQLQGNRVPPAARQWTGGGLVEPDLLLDSALADGAVGGVLDRLRPAHPQYRRLVQAWSVYHRLQSAGGWEVLVGSDPPRQGGQGWTEAALRRRLVAEGDLDSLIGGTGFGEQVDRALRRFQRRHGLAVNGRVDSPTGAALGVGVEERLRQLELNLERWRWLPLGPQARYLLVNLDDYTLDLVEGGQVALEMKVIAGKAQWRTPLFNSDLKQIVLNPYWNVPPSIAREEVLPALGQNPYYLEERGIRVVGGVGDQARVVPPDSVDWERADQEDWPYTFMQNPGPDNPLGQMKFLLPNPHHVYLHDTPNRELFFRAARDFSHGCIRLEKSLELAVHLLAGNPDWSRSRIRQVLESGQTRQVDLAHRVPVYFAYWTVGVDEEGLVYFRPDLYGADAALQEAWGR